MPPIRTEDEPDDLRPCPGGDCPMRLRCWRYTAREQNRRPLLPIGADWRRALQSAIHAGLG
jgi:hypothetical protein